MAYSKQTFTLNQVLTAAQCNQIEDNISDHDHSDSGVALVKIACSSDDTTPDFLENKIVGAGGIVVTTINGGSNEDIQIFGDPPSGTVMLFVQDLAPTGWTKGATHNNKTLRVVTGTPGTGGTDSFTTVFNSSKATQGHPLSISEMPAHSHDQNAKQAAGSNTGTTSTSDGTNAVSGGLTDPTGGGGSHTHDIQMDVQFVDVIIATKD